MNKHTAMSDATRKSLVDAFCTIYKDKPIEKITIQEITEKAGYTEAHFINTPLRPEWPKIAQSHR